jgi:hypothetical protein
VRPATRLRLHVVPGHGAREKTVAKASLAMPTGGHAGFAGVAVCFAGIDTLTIESALAKEAGG